MVSLQRKNVQPIAALVAFALDLEYFTHGLMQQLAEVKSLGVSVIRADVQSRQHGLGVRQAAVLLAIHEAGVIIAS